MSKIGLIKNPLIVALDVDSEKQALDLVDQLADIVGCFKLGPRLVHKYGKSLSEKIAQSTPVFVDCKFFDIPSTMEAAVQSSFDSGASLVTVHALAGAEALTRLSILEKKLNQIRPFKVLCVTILTSWDLQSIPSVMKSQSIDVHVNELINLVVQSGLDGVVCSSHELETITRKNLYLVTPGIRFSLEEQGDQKRIMSPGEAMKKGASALVVGRPIIEAKDPRQAALDYSMAIIDRR